MAGWLRALSPPFRYLTYAVGALLVFSVAAAVGAAAAVMVGWQSGQVTTSSSENSTFEGSKSETTGSADEATDSGDTVREISFVHRATEENSRADFTYISDPGINGHPNAIVLVSKERNNGSTSYDHHIGVWYVAGAHRWAIFNQDRTAVPAGATFRVEVPQPSTTLVHHAGPLNTARNYTYLDNRLTNGEPDAVLSVTQNWNPGGGGGVYNDHPVGTVYDGKLEKWAVYNLDGEPLPRGAAFNIAVSTGAKKPAS
jgi:hypothetical protein